MKPTHSRLLLPTLILALAPAPRVVAQTAAPAAVPAGSWFDFGTAPAAFAPAAKNTAWGQDVLQYIASAPLNQGRVILNQRLRYEGVSQTAVNDSKALTLRTRIGYETPKWNGFYGLGEFENTWAINSGSYAPYPAPFNGGKAVIADPRNNELNQLYVGYSGFNTEVKFGRQDLNLDNQRFVGTVDWRQNDQTYDAISVSTKIVNDLALSYTWNWQVDRVYGEDAPLPTLRRFDSNNHFFNLHYTGLPKYGTLAGYVYYLDLDGAAAAGQPLSSTTYGLYFDGRYKFDSDWAAIYRLEYAVQADNHDSGPRSFFDSYNNIILGGAYQKIEAGVGYEKLGGDGTRAFQTPLATLHAFNGWADQFLTTPATGLRDYSLWLRAPLPLALSLNTAAHYYTATNTDSTYGREFDVALSRKFGENFTATVKLARYWGNGLPQTGVRADVTKVWFQLEFNL